MIRYVLVCENDHRHSEWFASSAAFERLRGTDNLQCPQCGSTAIDRALMTPAVATGAKGSDGSALIEAGPPPVPAAVAGRACESSAAVPTLTDEASVALRALGQAVRRCVEQHGIDVGDRFAEEARKIHYGEADARNIYGQARPEEARELVEEGIAIIPLHEPASARN